MNTTGSENKIMSSGFSYIPDASLDTQKLVLNEFEVSTKYGEVAAIMAPSGSGKTTLLNLLSGLIGNREASFEKSVEKIGYSFQNDRLLPWKTVLENVLFPFNSTPRQVENRERAIELLAKLGLGATIDLFPKELSGGMRKRVSIARSLIIEPQLLLLDEALSGLDIETAVTTSKVVRNFVKEHSAICVHISHDPIHVALTGDRVHFMSEAPLQPIETLDIDEEINRELDDQSFLNVVSAIYVKVKMSK